MSREFIPNPWRGGPWDPNAGLQNTTRSVPAGNRKAGIPGVATGSPQRLALTSVGSATVWKTAQAGFGPFDLRPDLGAIGGGGDNRSIPVYRMEGINAGVCLWIYINGLQGTRSTTDGLTVTATEFAHPITEERMEQVKEPQDITSEFVGEKPAAALQCFPLGGSYPIRFWRIVLDFTWAKDLSGVGGDPSIFSMYSIY